MKVHQTIRKAPKTAMIFVQNGDGFGMSTSYDFGMGFSLVQHIPLLTVPTIRSLKRRLAVTKRKPGPWAEIRCQQRLSGECMQKPAT
jgi:hypothetical protein